MPIIYTISTILVFLLAVILKKTEEKIEIVKTLSLTLILELAYNCIVCYILNLTNIPITLTTLTVVNIIVSLIIGFKILKDKQIQKYKIKSENVLILIFFILLSIVLLMYTISGNFGKIRYITEDSMNHYIAAREFSEKTTLQKGFMPMGYSNIGIIFKVLAPYVGSIPLSNIYLAFETMIYMLAGLIFLFLLEDYCKGKFKTTITFIYTIFYILGYPLNAWISGFHYLVIGILYITTILYFIDKIKLDEKYEIIMLFLLNIGLIFSYCLFCPVVYLAEFIYFILKYYKNDKIKLLKLILISIVIPGIIGVSYIILPSKEDIINGIAQEGYIYKNVWSNFILFIPFALYCIYINIKNKKITIDNVMLAMLIIYMLVLFIGMQNKLCSSYYFYKTYFFLWILIIELNIKGMIYFLEKNKLNKIIVSILTTAYILTFIFCVYYIYTPQTKNAKDSNPMEIYTFNSSIMSNKKTMLSKKEYKLLLQMEKIIENNWKKLDNEHILLIADRMQLKWNYAFTGYKNDIKEDQKEPERQKIMKKIGSDTYNYIIELKSTRANADYINYINKENYNIIYEDSAGIIYQKESK